MADKVKLGEYFEYLDDLRESGETNMWGCARYLESEFGMARKESCDVAGLWMNTFDGTSTVEERVEKALEEKG